MFVDSHRRGDGVGRYRGLARQKCVVFSSIRGDDLDLSATSAPGVHALKGYLDYAQTGRLPEIEVGQGEFGSDFEQAVHHALVEKGLRLHTQVGCAGYAIDLAVVDPENPGRYLLGIECDGATYHGSATARDRDRLRQQVLEGLGWRIHRIWSTEWFQKPQSEVQRVLEAVRQAKAGLLRPRFATAVSSAPKPTSLFDELPKDSQTQSSDAIIPTQPYGEVIALHEAGHAVLRDALFQEFWDTIIHTSMDGKLTEDYKMIPSIMYLLSSPNELLEWATVLGCG